MKQGQRPGKACEECRRRKLKCNGAEPQCSVCADSGIECVVIREREARGPKKGYLKVLRDRIGAVFIHFQLCQNFFELTWVISRSRMPAARKPAPRPDVVQLPQQLLHEQGDLRPNSASTSCSRHR